MDCNKWPEWITQDGSGVLTALITSHPFKFSGGHQRVELLLNKTTAQ